MTFTYETGKRKKNNTKVKKITDHINDMLDHTDILTLMDAIGIMYHYPFFRSAINMPFLILKFHTVGKNQLGSF